MRLFPKLKFRRKTKLANLDKELDARLAKYATHEELEQYFKNKVEAKKKKELWNSLSPRMKRKVLQRIAERNKNAKK